MKETGWAHLKNVVQEQRCSQAVAQIHAQTVQALSRASSKLCHSKKQTQAKMNARAPSMRPL
jgi:hypothetical protein